MIDRRTALICVALIALMLAAAVWRFTAMIPAAGNGAPVLQLLLFVVPASNALIVGLLYWVGAPARADAAKLLPWHRWGAFVAFLNCSGSLLLQAIVVIQSLGLHVPWGIGNTVTMAITGVWLLAINRLPKLPWFERRLAPGGHLGPIYGPRYLRIQSRILVVFMIALLAFGFTTQRPIGPAATLYFLVATVLLIICLFAWRLHLARKWKRQQSAEPGLT